ncbi:TPA: glycoside hydrolase family 3 protein [Streptococcus agalactiae]
MTHLVDLTKKPFNLNQEAIEWIEKTINEMTLDEKIGQLFFNMGASRSEEYLTDVLDRYHIAAVRYNRGSSSEIYDQNLILQTKSKLPMLIAANTEAGGDGAVTDGTKVGDEIKVAATNDPKYAYEMGRIAGMEASAVGCNASFAPIVDLTRNWRNPIIASRNWGANVDQIISLSKEYMKGIMQYNIVPFAKHFPERDLDDMLPASLNKTLLDELLRGELGYNGAIVTDASHMVGMTASMPRRDLLPTAIEAGCDLFLFFNDPDEDIQWMKEGYEKGILTEERLHDALRRTLGLKAKLGLHNYEGRRQELFMPKDKAMALINTLESQKIADEVADKAVTLVKDKQKDIFPVNPERYRHILLVNVEGYKGGFGAMIAGNKQRASDYMKELLDARGHEVTVWESTEERIMKLPQEERAAAIANVYAQKQPIANLTEHYDLIINLVDVNAGGTTQRIIWPAAKGTPDQPFYVHEIPSIVISVQHAFALADMPQVGTYINAYDGLPSTISAVVAKLAGESEFTGVSPVDAYCGLIDTHLWRQC